MIVEGLVTTRLAGGHINLAPMGPVVNAAQTEFRFRPFKSSITYQNLRQTGCGVFHIVDDVYLVAAAALNQLVELPPLRPAEQIDGAILVDCCRWFEFEVTHIDDVHDRTEMATRVVAEGVGRPFWGFHRARHAVLEATILATRLHLVPESQVRADLQRWSVPVQKTAGEREHLAWDLVCRYVDEWYRTTSARPISSDGQATDSLLASNASATSESAAPAASDRRQ
jgi:uncharacterized protein